MNKCFKCFNKAHHDYLQRLAYLVHGPVWGIEAALGDVVFPFVFLPTGHNVQETRSVLQTGDVLSCYKNAL